MHRYMKSWVAILACCCCWYSLWNFLYRKEGSSCDLPFAKGCRCTDRFHVPAGIDAHDQAILDTLGGVPSRKMIENSAFEYVKPVVVEATKVSKSLASPTKVMKLHKAPKTNKEDFEAQLKEIYTVYNPDKIEEIPTIMEAFKGREKELLEQLHIK